MVLCHCFEVDAPDAMASFSDELSGVTLKFQRDANCLSDPDRSTRKRALVKLTKSLLDDKVAIQPRPTSHHRARRNAYPFLFVTFNAATALWGI